MPDAGFSAQERAAMRQRTQELRASQGLRGAERLATEYEACVKAIDALEGTDAEVALALHRIVTTEAPELTPKTWYGFPSYARDGHVVVFYQPASKFGSRYGTVGFNEHARLDDGVMWATSFAVTAVSGAVEQRLRDLVRRAAG